MSVIQSYKGHKIWPLLPNNEQVIDIEDIAHSISLQCRFNGHCEFFYSVAEHSVYVADYIFHKTKDKRLALGGLLHDSTEAYIGDIPTPIKKLIPGIKEIEEAWFLKILVMFNISLSESDLLIIKDADMRMLITEKEQLTVKESFDWGLPKLDPLNIKIKCLSPKEAENLFHKRLEFYNNYQRKEYKCDSWYKDEKDGGVRFLCKDDYNESIEYFYLPDQDYNFNLKGKLFVINNGKIKFLEEVSNLNEAKEFIDKHYCDNLNKE